MEGQRGEKHNKTADLKPNMTKKQTAAAATSGD
jgi:hypothetical protein